MHQSTVRAEDQNGRNRRKVRRILRHYNLDSAFLYHYLGMFESAQAHSRHSDVCKDRGGTKQKGPAFPLVPSLIACCFRPCCQSLRFAVEPSRWLTRLLSHNNDSFVLKYLRSLLEIDCDTQSVQLRRRLFINSRNLSRSIFMLIV